MSPDSQRIEMVRQSLSDARLEGLICALPRHVLMLSGYWPVVGNSLAVVAGDGRIGLVVPEDERELAGGSWAGEVRTFSAGSLQFISDTITQAAPELRSLCRTLGLEGAMVGIEDWEHFEPASYASMHLYGAAIRELIGAAVPAARQTPASELLTRLSMRETSREIGRIETACGIAERAFCEGAAALREGMTEPEVARSFRAGLSDIPQGVERADGFVWCMSGPNAAEAYKSYQITRSRRIERGDLVLVHCNSYADGFWTDITRTYCIGEPDPRQKRMFQAVEGARAAGIAAIRPGVRARDIDAAARRVMLAGGFGEAFRHPTGHGVGFVAIDHNAPPRLHPKSDDIIEEGMVFNVEPGIYLPGQGGMRRCDMVVATAGGARNLTPFA